MHCATNNSNKNTRKASIVRCPDSEFVCGRFSTARSEVLPNLRHAGVFQMSTMFNLGIRYEFKSLWHRRFVKHNYVLSFIHCHGKSVYIVFTVNSSVNAARSSCRRKFHVKGIKLKTFTQGYVISLCARVQGLDLVLGHRHCAQFLARVF